MDGVGAAIIVDDLCHEIRKAMDARGDGGPVMVSLIPRRLSVLCDKTLTSRSRFASILLLWTSIRM